MNRKARKTDSPDVKELRAELDRIRHKRKYKRVLRSTLYTLIVVAAVSVLVATLWMPVLQIYGTSMTPTLYDGDIVISVKDTEPDHQDVIAFYYNNKILVKRVIAGPGEWVDIDEDGNVFVNSIPLDEPYISEKAKGECNIEFPYQVPEAKYFVMGDHRSVSTDSRNTAVGCVSEEQIVGRISFRVWPLKSIGATG